MSYQLISDGSCDLGKALAEEKDIRVVPFYVSFDGETFHKEIEEMGVREFYQEMVDHPKVFPKSSLPSVQDFLDAFEDSAKKGMDIICICITTKFSGSFNSALNAKELLKEVYPDIRVTVIDATVNTVLQGLYVLEAARMKKDGLSYEETVKNLERIKSTGRIIFTVGSIDYLKQGGRIGKLAGLAAGALSLKPLILLKEGEIFPAGITRSRRKSMSRVLELVKQHFQETSETPEDYVFAVGYGYDRQEAEEFLHEFEKEMQPEINPGSTLFAQIGATIGVHTGPYPLGVGLMKRYDRGKI